MIPPYLSGQVAPSNRLSPSHRSLKSSSCNYPKSIFLHPGTVRNISFQHPSNVELGIKESDDILNYY